MNKAIKVLHEILGTTTKIAMTVKIIAIVLFLFCSWMSINYFFQHYPDAEVTSKPFDYNGMLVSFFSLLVTLLVGWNIYSTINAKNDYDFLHNQYKSKIKAIESDNSEIKSQLKQLEDSYNKDIERIDKLPYLTTLYQFGCSARESGNYILAIQNLASVVAENYDYALIRESARIIAELLIRNAKDLKTQGKRRLVYGPLNKVVKTMVENKAIDRCDVETIRNFLNKHGAFSK